MDEASLSVHNKSTEKKKTSWKVAGSSQLSLFDDVNAERHDVQEGHCQVDVSGERPRVVENSKVWPPAAAGSATRVGEEAVPTRELPPASCQTARSPLVSSSATYPSPPL